MKDSGDRTSVSYPPEDPPCAEAEMAQGETTDTLGQWPMAWPADERAGRKRTIRSKAVRAGMENGDGHMGECTEPKISASHISAHQKESTVKRKKPPNR